MKRNQVPEALNISISVTTCRSPEGVGDVLFIPHVLILLGQHRLLRYEVHHDLAAEESPSSLGFLLWGLRRLNWALESGTTPTFTFTPTVSFLPTHPCNYGCQSTGGIFFFPFGHILSSAQYVCDTSERPKEMCETTWNSWFFQFITDARDTGHQAVDSTPLQEEIMKGSCPSTQDHVVLCAYNTFGTLGCPTSWHVLRPKFHSNKYLQTYLSLYYILSNKGCGVPIHCHVSPIQGLYLVCSFEFSPILSFFIS